jgi:hypothetical protein
MEMMEAVEEINDALPLASDFAGGFASDFAGGFASDFAGGSASDFAGGFASDFAGGFASDPDNLIILFFIISSMEEFW